MCRPALLAALCLVSGSHAAPRDLVADGRSAYVIRLCEGATPAERHAADELRRYLGKIAGVELPVQEGGALPDLALVVGRDAESDKLAPGADWANLGGEGFFLRTAGTRLLLAGGRPRGTLYAVYSFLDEELGCRWLAPDCEIVPRRPGLALPVVDRAYKPRLEYRETFSHSAYDGDWAARNFSNGHAANLLERHGGKTVYAGFVHTFYPLLPPEKHFAEHPEWYSEIGGKRTVERAQLCLTNPEVVEAMAGAVREWLRKHPEATLVSVSQNDWHGACQCPDCRAVDAEEGGPSGAMIRFVNGVAERIEKEFPAVAVDTLAYQYTRHPPRLARPRPNVVVRLCSIECCFSHPLEKCPENAAFVSDLVGWSKICDRLYVWDYVTNFSHYLLPHPNLDVLEPNLRFFASHGVKGVFEQGEYQTPGGEMLELRSYVVARLLRDPGHGAQRAADEFLDGYFGPSAEPVRRYLRLLHDKVAKENLHMRCYEQPGAPLFTPETMAEADRLFEEAERLAGADATFLRRVRVARLPVQYVMLERGRAWSRAAARAGKPVGPFGPGWSDRALADRFLAVAEAAGVTRSSEGREFDLYRARLEGLIDRKPPSPPPGLENVAPARLVDVQDDEFSLFREGELCGIRAEPTASDGGCAWLSGATSEWALQFPVPPRLLTDGKRYTLHAVVRVKKGADTGDAFGWGLYDTESKKSLVEARLPARAAAPDWTRYELGPFEAGGKPYVWFAGCRNGAAVPEILVDRVCFVEAEE